MRRQTVRSTSSLGAQRSAPIKIKDEADTALTLRRSCREVIGGSRAITVSRKNGLAGLLYIEPDANAIEIQPLPHSYVVTDSMPDLTNFYNQYKLAEPWLKRKDVRKKGETATL
jgi:succinate dehydrogenase (ubiquinone) iron-sulfur subunit